MRLPFTILRAVLLGLMLVGLHACTHRVEELPTPGPVGPALSAEDARAWYQGIIVAPNAGGRPAASTQAPSCSANSAQQLLRWNRTRTVGEGANQLLLVPLANDAALFAHSTHVGTRYLVVTHTPAGAFRGNILELLLRRTATPVDTTALFAALYRNCQNGFSAPVSGDGLVLLYSADYQYLTGRRFCNGHFLAGTARLAFQLHSDGSTEVHVANRGVAANGSVAAGGGMTTNFTEMPDETCTDWYDGNTGEYITTTGDCGDGGGTGTGGYEPPYTGPGTTGPGGYDPNPNSGGGINNPGGNTGVVTVQVLTSGPKINPRQETRCFNISQAATLTVYVQQGRAGTRDKVGPAQVGHTFIGIEQNGITRYMGYYPESTASSVGVMVGANYTGELHDNSNSLYDVSITAPITSSQLANILNYINNYPSVYNLNNYNCADFGIAVGNRGGMSLPATTSSGLFSGRSPGDLGEDIRGMNPPANGSINRTGGNAPNKQGNCP